MKNTLKFFIVVAMLASSAQVFAGVNDSAGGSEQRGNYLCYTIPKDRLPSKYYMVKDDDVVPDSYYANYLSEKYMDAKGTSEEERAIAWDVINNGSWECDHIPVN